MTETERDNCIIELFNDAVELDETERVTFLDSAAIDPSMRDEVRMMIDAHERAGDFLADPETDIDERPGAVIGRYKLHTLIGEGGFGRVYLALQREPVIRKVALKIIKLGMDTRQVIARFEAERQALAMMNHPNIATVFDAGATARGRPYFVMELVGESGGVPITEYCDQNDLSLTQRLELFQQVCSAVQHAHTKGIIHRDIKPTNVLVSRNGDHNGMAAPKVIDFGIAKATGARLADETYHTEHRQLVGTPEYMSPEQADVNAADIDTRSDVYSLGVLLYELLTGATPCDRKRLRTAAFGDVQRIIRNEEAPKPSTRFSTMGADAARIIAAQRNLEPCRLTMHLRGDLDCITLKALEKDRERRYGSASELAEDIRRHLNHEPVLASPRSLAYRTSKFIRRHRVGVATAILITIALLGGAIGIVGGIVHARESTAQTVAVNSFMREVLSSADPDNDGSQVRLVDVLDNASGEASIRFAGQPALEAQVHDLLGSVYGRLAMWSRAEGEFRRAMSMWESCAGPDDPRTLSSTVQLGQVLANQERGRDAEQFLDGLIPRLHRVFGIDHEQSLEGEMVLAHMLSLRGRFDESESMLRDALIRAEDQGVSVSLRLRLLNRLSSTLLDGSNIAPSRETAINECRAVTTQLLEQSLQAGKAGTWHSLTARITLTNLAMRCEQFADAAAQARQLLVDSKERLSECHNVRREAMRLLADAQCRMGDTHEPADLYLRLLECLRSDGSNSTRLVISLTDGLYVLFKDNRWSEGEACARELIRTVHELDSPHVTTYYGEAFLACFVTQQGRLDEAGVIFDSLLSRYDQANETDRTCLNFGYASYLVKRGEFEQAENRLKMLIPSIDPKAFKYAESMDDYLRVFVELYEAWNKPDTAEEYRRLLH